MSSLHLGTILKKLRRLAGDEPGSQTDGLLLERFLQNREQAAFEALVQRHGRMVLGVAQSILNDAHTAEDVFQATFLVLARKAGSIRKQASVASWLYGAALRIARNARSSLARRRKHEKQVPPMSTSQSPVEPSDLKPMLVEELDRMPEKYRAPLVLCYLEGKTNEEAAQELQWPSGTVKGRLARAREMLRGRLARRGIALSAAALTVALEQQANAATLPAALVQATAQAALPFAAGHAVSGEAALLANQALKQMFASKARLTAAALLLLGVASTGAALFYSAFVPNDFDNQKTTNKPLTDDRLDPNVHATFAASEYYQGFPVAVAFSEDSAQLAVLTRRDDGTDLLIAQDVASGKQISSFNLKEGFRTAVGDGKVLVVVHADDLAETCSIDVLEAKTLKGLHHVEEISPVSPSDAAVHGEQIVLVGTRNPGLRQPGAGNGVGGFGGGFGGGLGGGLGLESSAVLIRDLEGKKEPVVYTLPVGAITRGTQLVSAEDGLKLYFMASQLDLNRPDDIGKLELHVMDLRTGTLTGIARGLTMPGNLAVSRDGKFAAVQTGEQTIEVWDLAAKKQPHTIETKDAAILCHGFSAGGKVLAVGTSDRLVTLRDVDTGKVLHTLEQPRAQQLKLSPDGRWLAGASPDAIKIWKLTR
ncbi:MAG: sigma-70 family RNA polymerase sigma factor [Gemmataceae bacterium]